jgi:Fe2+ or Zn2+ uptake regulation protein
MGITSKSILILIGTSLNFASHCIASKSPEILDDKGNVIIATTVNSKNVSPTNKVSHDLVLAVTHDGQLSRLLEKLKNERTRVSSADIFSTENLKAWTRAIFVNETIFKEIYTRLSTNHTSANHNMYWKYHTSRQIVNSNVDIEKIAHDDEKYMEWAYTMYMLSKWDMYQ